MDKIILAYCRENADLAELIDQKLSRVGIPFEHVTNMPGMMPGQFAALVSSTSAPVILLITDNYLKNQACMASGLNLLQQLVRTGRILPVVADGRVDRSGNGKFEVAPTQFERVIHAIQYMNFWQSAYLELRAKRESIEESDVAVFEQRLGVVRDISNEIGEFLNLLRDAEYVTYERFASNDFELFFRKFSIMDWHDQYRKLAAFDLLPNAWENLSTVGQPAEKSAEPVQVETETIPQLVENQEIARTHNALFVEEKPIPRATEFVLPSEAMPSTNGFSGMDALIDEIVREEREFEMPFEINALDEPMEIFEQSVGQTFQALNPIGISAEEDSHFEKNEVAPPEISPQETPDAKKQTEETRTEVAENQLIVQTLPDMQAKPVEKASRDFIIEMANIGQFIRARSLAEQYQEEGEITAEGMEILGDIALIEGDVLSAKLCWEKAASKDKFLPGIYLKLGKLTEEHQKGHKKQAAEFLKLAIEQDSDNAEIHYRLANIYLEHLDERDLAIRYLLNTVALRADHPNAWFDLATAYREAGIYEKAEVCYKRALQNNPSIQSEINDRLYLIQKPEPQPEAPKKTVLTVCITGATSGIGFATAEIFAKNGHRLILIGRREERLNEMKTEFSKNFKNENLTITLDVRDFKAVGETFASLPENFQNIDILLNNAGLAKGLDFIHEGNLEHWEAMIDTNLKGLLYVTRAVSPGMVARKRGHIINICSSAGKEVYPKGNVYCATKFGVDALTRAMRLDLHNHNIRVSQVSPGHVEETEFAVTRFDGDAERAKIYEDFQPLKSSDVAEAIFFIVSRPPHVNIQDIVMFGTQQASSMIIDRSGR